MTAFALQIIAATLIIAILMAMLFAGAALLLVICAGPGPWDGSDDSEFWQGWRPDPTDTPPQQESDQ